MDGIPGGDVPVLKQELASPGGGSLRHREHLVAQLGRRAIDLASDLGLLKREIAVQNLLQEILHRYFALQKPEIAREVYGAATELCDEVLPVSERTTARARELLLQYRNITARDAVHIAAMEEGGLRRLLSTDSDFDTVDEVQRVDPADFPG